jgi:hypothetical protein
MSKIELDDFILHDPFHDIYIRKKDDGSDFYYVYVDYHDYLRYLQIIWRRIKDEYDTIMEYNSQSNSLLSSREVNFDDYRRVTIESLETQNVIQCDIETFVIFARRFLDKVGKIVVKLTKLPHGKQIGRSFTDHKKDFIKYNDLKPMYSLLLKDDTNWYEQDLLLWRDKILMHGETLNTTCLVSPTRGIILIKTRGVFEISERNKEKFMRIKKKFERIDPDLKINDNQFMMIDDFRRKIAERNIRLEEEDRNTLGDILMATGASLDIREIARNVKDFTKKAASIFSS